MSAHLILKFNIDDIEAKMIDDGAIEIFRILNVDGREREKFALKFDQIRFFFTTKRDNKMMILVKAQK